MNWQDRAACIGKPTSWWFPIDDPRSLHTWDNGREICMTCPVIVQCRAAGANEQYGMWGGLTPADRGFRQGRRRQFAGRR